MKTSIHHDPSSKQASLVFHHSYFASSNMHVTINQALPPQGSYRSASMPLKFFESLPLPEFAESPPKQFSFQPHTLYSEAEGTQSCLLATCWVAVLKNTLLMRRGCKPTGPALPNTTKRKGTSYSTTTLHANPSVSSAPKSAGSIQPEVARYRRRDFNNNFILYSNVISHPIPCMT